MPMHHENFLDEALKRGYIKEKSNPANPTHICVSKFFPGGLGEVVVNYWGSTGTIRTQLTHPKHTKETFWNKDCERKGLSDEQILGVLDNPRMHTGIGDVHRKPKPQMLNASEPDALRGA
ncbi:unnamed protein product [Amoebophrya sp. A25]|nr:unnamed protein product [Amoebophrya sp. A25]|eukprot:GSA25T00006229001.1